MRFRGVLYGAILLMAAAGCGSPSAAPPSAPPAVSWREPTAYVFSFESTCGDRPLRGHFRAQVTDGVVSATEGLDDAARRALMLRIADLVPTLGTMEREAVQARDEGKAVTIERDTTDGHPLSIRVADETCVAVTGYTIGGKPAPSGT